MSHASIFTPSLQTMARRALIAGAIAAALAGCATPPAPATLADTVANNPALHTFNSLLIQSGLNNTLRTDGPFTVLAPTNDAFKGVPAATMDAWAKHPEQLKAVMSYHVMLGTTLAADVKNSSAKTLNGASVALSKAGDFVTIENAAVVTPNLGASNGVVHTIDAVLIPPKK